LGKSCDIHRGRNEGGKKNKGHHQSRLLGGAGGLRRGGEKTNRLKKKIPEHNATGPEKYPGRARK